MRLRATRLFAVGNAMSGNRPRVLYHGHAVYELDVVSNWYTDYNRTVLATSLPTAIDTCHLSDLGYYPDETNVLGELTGSLTCAKLYLYSNTVFQDVPGISIFTPEVIIVQTVSLNYVEGYSFPITTIVYSDAESAVVNMNAPSAIATFDGTYTNIQSTFNVCDLNGDFSSFGGLVNNLIINGENCYSTALVGTHLELNGDYSGFDGSCTGSAIANGNYTGFGGSSVVSQNIYLNGDESFMDFNSICFGNVYMSGPDSYLQSTAYITGDVYYNPMVVTDPTGTAIIDGTVYNYIP